MSDMESRLTDAMKNQTSNVEPGDEQAALDHIAGRIDRRRRRALVVVGAAATVAVLVGAIALLQRDDGKSNVNVTTASSPEPSVTEPPSSSTETTATTATTETSTASSSSASETPVTEPPTTVPPLPASVPHVWPLDGTGGFATPEDAAHSFFADYLGMTEEQLGRGSIDTVGHATVEGFPRQPGSATTVVDLVQTSAGWVVAGARADEIVVDTPRPNDDIQNPMTVSGRSVAFEAQLGLEIRPAGSTTVVATGTAMGGSSEMQPFSTTINAPEGDAAMVLLVFEGDASGAQTFSKVTVVLLRTGQHALDGG